MSVGIRPAAVAGAFYPAGRRALRRIIADCFDGAVRRTPDARWPKALIVPHAGYVYSGPIAAAAYDRITPFAGSIRRVVLLGPSHRAWIDGIALPSSDAFETPLGLVPIDPELRMAVEDLPGVIVDDRAHMAEHSLEVQLPFLQSMLDDFSLLPLSIGDATTAEVAAVLDACWGGPETLIVVSTDLSHYLGYLDAVGVDERTAGHIVAMRPEAISDTDACGARGLRGLLDTASARGMTVERIDVRNSGDTAGDRSRVVGYGAFAVV